MLAGLLSRYPEALEADLQRYYQVDLVDLYRGEITPRRLAVLAKCLPRGALVWQLLGGPGAITAEEEALWGVHYLQQLRLFQAGDSKGEKPTMQDYPEGEQAAKAATDRLEANAKAWREQQNKFRQ